MYKLLFLIAVAACLYVGYLEKNPAPRREAAGFTAATSQGDRILANAFQAQQSNQTIDGSSGQPRDGSFPARVRKPMLRLTSAANFHMPTYSRTVQ